MHRIRLTSLGGLLILLAVGRPLRAQTRSTFDVGVSRLELEAERNSAIGPSAQWQASLERARLFSSISGTGFAAGGTLSGAAGGTVQWRWYPALPWRIDSGLELSSIGGSGARTATTARGSLRLIRVMDVGGAWVRAGTSASRREAGTLPARNVDAGVWWGERRALLAASAKHEWSTAQLFLGTDRRNVVGTTAVRYTEGATTMQLRGDDATLTLGGVVRRDPGAERVIDAGWTAELALWRSANVAFVLAAARTLPDFERGADALRAITLGIRIGEPPPAGDPALRGRPIVQVGEHADERGRVLRIRAAGARRVEVRGDFTDWEPVQLAPDGDGFRLSAPLSSGTHRVLVRVDDGEWPPAANTPAVDDDLGGRVGLLVVP